MNSLSAQNKTIWIHAASAGEFEQAIPLINRIRANKPDFQVAVSFYSPSGYELYRDSGLADVFFYFPPDLPGNARLLLEKLRPELAIFIRNETWWNTLKQLKDQYIPAILINAERHRGRGLYGRYLDRCLPLFTRVYYTDQIGSTKAERVLDVARTDFRDDTLEAFARDSFVLVLGSCYDPEARMAATVFNRIKDRYPALKIACCPHAWDEQTPGRYATIFGDTLGLYSRQASQGRLLFIDRMGILKYAYRYAGSAMVGGGSGKGVHNVSEAAVYGLPVCIGPNYKGFPDTAEMVQQGRVTVVTNAAELEEWLLSIADNAIAGNKDPQTRDMTIPTGPTVSERIWSDASELIRR